MYHLGLKTLHLPSVRSHQNLIQSENGDELASRLRFPPSTLGYQLESPVTLHGMDPRSKMHGSVYVICVHRE